MATKEKKQTETLERTYVVNLRRGFIKAPSYKKTSKAVKELREFIIHHMKCPDVHICKELNDLVWLHGKKNPPAKVEVKCLKKDNVVYVQLPNKPFEEPKKEETAKEKKVKVSEKDKALETKKEEEAEEKKEVLEHPDKKLKTHDVEAKEHKKDIMNIVDNKTSMIRETKKQ